MDIEYKTLGIQWDTTSKDVVTQILRRYYIVGLFGEILYIHTLYDITLSRCKMRQRDSRLFYLSMEVTVRKADVKRVIALDDDTRPAILQACHPKGDSRYLYYNLLNDRLE